MNELNINLDLTELEKSYQTLLNVIQTRICYLKNNNDELGIKILVNMANTIAGSLDKKSLTKCVTMLNEYQLSRMNYLEKNILNDDNDSDDDDIIDIIDNDYEMCIYTNMLSNLAEKRLLLKK
jgi:hypothetical protein